MALKPETMDKIFALLPKADEDQLRMINQILISQLRLIQQRKALENRSKIMVGTRVQISDNIKPRYLAGQRGEVISMVGKNVEVKLDCGPINRFSRGRVTFRDAAPLTVI